MSGTRAQGGLDAELRARYVDLIAERFGLRVTASQLMTLDHAIEEMLRETGYDTPDALRRAFEAGWRPDLLEALAARLTVGETHFMRVRPQIEALKGTVLPELIARRRLARRLRLWSAGCSTGEEAYTLAILLQEQLPAVQDWSISFLATDMSDQALDTARAGLYRAWSFRETPQEVRDRYFTPEEGRWRLDEGIRRMVHFAHLNLAADWPPSPATVDVDLIVCRNVTIYFRDEAVRQLYRRFAAALAPDGWLVLGPSDPPPEDAHHFKPVSLPGAVLWRRPETVESRTTVHHSIPAAHARRPPPGSGTASTPRRQADRSSTRPSRSETARAWDNALPELSQVRGLIQQGHLQEAREQAERLVRARPTEAEAHLLLGMLYLDAGAPQPALESLRRAAFLDDADAVAHFALGRAHAQLGNQAQATASFIHARRLLAALPEGGRIPGHDEMSVDELRHALDGQLGRAAGGGGV